MNIFFYILEWIGTFLVIWGLNFVTRRLLGMKLNPITVGGVYVHHRWVSSLFDCPLYTNSFQTRGILSAYAGPGVSICL